MTDQQTAPGGKRGWRRTEVFFILDFVVLWLMLLMLATGLLIRYVLPPGSGGRGGGHGLLLWGLDRHAWGGLHFWASLLLLLLLLLHVALHWTWVCGVVRRRLGDERGPVTYGHLLRWGLLTLGAVALLVGGFMGLTWASVEQRPLGETTTASALQRAPARGARPGALSERSPLERSLDAARRPAAEVAALPCEETHGELCAVDGAPQERGARAGRAGDTRRPALLGRGRGGAGRGLGPGSGGRAGRGLGRGAATDRGLDSSHEQESIRGYMTLAEVARESGLSVAQLRARLGLPDSVPADARLGRLRRSHGLSLEAVRSAVRH
jgi:hypothetical protein